jgi:hypothetical protein
MHACNKMTCSVCLEPCNDTDLPVKLTCSHSFHKYCILEWGDTQSQSCNIYPNCPICRRNVVTCTGGWTGPSTVHIYEGAIVVDKFVNEYFDRTSVQFICPFPGNAATWKTTYKVMIDGRAGYVDVDNHQLPADSPNVIHLQDGTVIPFEVIGCGYFNL